MWKIFSSFTLHAFLKYSLWRIDISKFYPYKWVWENVDLKIISFVYQIDNIYPALKIWSILDFLYNSVYFSFITFFPFLIYCWWRGTNNKNIREQVIYVYNIFLYACFFAICTTFITYFVLPIKYPLPMPVKGSEMRSFPSFHAIPPLLSYLFVSKMAHLWRKRDIYLFSKKEYFLLRIYSYFALTFTLMIFINIIAYKKHYFVDGIGSLIYAVLCWKISNKIELKKEEEFNQGKIFLVVIFITVIFFLFYFFEQTWIQLPF